MAGGLLKRVILELGGNNALIVLDDADLDAAASAGAWGAFLHQGQICMAASRHLVHRKIAGAYVERLAAKARALPVGDPFRENVALGPLINYRQVERVQKIVDGTVAAGARLVTGGTHDGLFYKATVLDGVTASMPGFTEEIFGPVAPVIVFDSDEEAAALANATDYGLSTGIQTASTARGTALAEKLRTGMVHVNDQPVNAAAHAPFGGMGASGNGSRFGALTNADEFSIWKWTTISDTSPPYPF
jgi:benzaldehyde dehydrogenase (NAD)